MSKERQNQIDELRWISERKTKKAKFKENVSSIIDLSNLSFLSFKDSGAFQIKADKWPSDKWENELSDTGSIDRMISNFFNLIEIEYVYIFLLNYNFGLIQVKKTDFVLHWENLLEMDGDDIYCYNPTKGEFICIEKTEDILNDRKKEGPMWIYELTISNKKLSKKIKTGI